MKWCTLLMSIWDPRLPSPESLFSGECKVCSPFCWNRFVFRDKNTQTQKKNTVTPLCWVFWKNMSTFNYQDKTNGLTDPCRSSVRSHFSVVLLCKIFFRSKKKEICCLSFVILITDSRPPNWPSNPRSDSTVRLLGSVPESPVFIPEPTLVFV